MAISGEVPEVPDDGDTNRHVRAHGATARFINDLIRTGSFSRPAGADRWGLTITDADIPSTITRDTELTAAIAALKFTSPLFDHFADGATTSTDGTENDLYSDTLAAGALAANGDKIDIHYAGFWIGHATATRRIRVYFGGSALLDTDNILISDDAAWDVRVSLIRVSTTVIRASAVLLSEATPQGLYPSYAEITGLTLSNTQVVKITGVATAAGAASGDITATLGSISRTPAV